jgi:hypothetical protein
MSVAVLVAGVLTGFSIGAFIAPIGIAMLVLGPVRRRRRVFWPSLVAVIGFELGYLLFVPLTCTTTATIPGGAGETVCTSILGPTFRTPGVGNPPADLALVAGWIVALAAGAVALLAVTRSGRQGHGRDLGDGPG